MSCSPCLSSPQAFLSLFPYQTQAFLNLKLLLKPQCDSMYIYTSPLLHLPSLFQIFVSYLFQFLLVWKFHSLPFSLSCWWLCSGNGHGLWVVVWWSDGVIWFCGSMFVGLSSWVWVRGSSTWPAWIVKLTSVDHQLDQRGWDGSSTWSAWVSDRCYGRWNCGGWWPTIGRIAGLRQWDREAERERETVRPRGRDDEKK